MTNRQQRAVVGTSRRASPRSAVLAICLLVCLAAPVSSFAAPAGQAGSAARQRRHERLRQYASSTYGPSAIGQSAATAGIAHARGQPREWGGGFAGYGRRLASGFGQHVIRGSIEAGVAAWRHENNSYVPSGQQGVWKRTRHAVIHTFMVRKDDGRRTFSSSRVAGAMGSGMISRAWYPARYHTVTSGLSTGGISLGAQVGVNMVREFLSRRRPTSKLRRQTP